MDLEATQGKLRDALDANADAAKESAGKDPTLAEASAAAALKLSQAVATLANARVK